MSLEKPRSGPACLVVRLSQYFIARPGFTCVLICLHGAFRSIDGLARKFVSCIRPGKATVAALGRQHASASWAGSDSRGDRSIDVYEV